MPPTFGHSIPYPVQCNSPIISIEPMCELCYSKKDISNVYLITDDAYISKIVTLKDVPADTSPTIKSVCARCIECLCQLRKEISPKECTCEISVLMARGCQCGSIGEAN